jgi:hypothetical protein
VSRAFVTKSKRLDLKVANDRSTAPPRARHLLTLKENRRAPPLENAVEGPEL